MKVKEVIEIIEKWAPPGVAWDRDNVGLQIGNTENPVSRVLLSLDVTENVVNYATENNFNLIISHHPLFFFPVKKIQFNSDTKSKIIKKLIENNISVFSAHTNLDFTKEGVSYQLAKKLGLSKIQFLHNIADKQYKLVVFVPSEFKDKVANAIFEAGGGIIGEYEKCSFEIKGTGTFQGSEKSNPVIGTKQNFEKVEEIRLEVLVDNWKLNGVIKALISSHPYEEPAYDIYVLKNSNVNYGEGAIGELNAPMKIKDFLELVASKLKIPAIRYAKGKSARIKKVAVCGGTCSSLVNEAISQNADAFVTADIKYHEFQDAEGKILFIDAGHYETENTVLPEVKRKLNEYAKSRKEKLTVKIYRQSTNPVNYYIKYKGEMK